jgi:hypothetical protein
VNLLLKCALLEHTFWGINGASCIELNNAWTKHKIKFKDPFRVLPMGLEKVCKELEVKHQKLTETASRDGTT